MSKDELRVPVGMGKYTFISSDNDYQIHVHRYNEPWLEIGPGHKAIYCLMAELDEARKRILELEKKLGPKPVPAPSEAEEYLNNVAETIGVAAAPRGLNGAAVLMMVKECLNFIPPGYRDNGMVEGMRKMAEELQDWREGAEAGFGVMTARPRATLIALGDRLRELEDGLDD
jgi:hypothetical protein